MSSSAPPLSHNHEPTTETQLQTGPPQKPTSEIKKPIFLTPQLHPQKPTWVLPYRTPFLKSLYSIGRKLGQGQLGITVLCTDKSTGTPFACKSVPKKRLICREDYEDVWREIQIMHHLSEHPNVVRIKGTYEDALFVHIVMELCAGGELFDRIVQKGHYSEREAAKLIKTIVGVVEGCHSLGVMHRDLKPENFLFLSADEDAALKAYLFSINQMKALAMLWEFLIMLHQRFCKSIMDPRQMYGVLELFSIFYSVVFHLSEQKLRWEFSARYYEENWT